MRAELFDKIDARFGVLQARVDAILPETKGSFARSASCPTRCRPPRDQLMLDRPDAQSSARFIDLDHARSRCFPFQPRAEPCPVITRAAPLALPQRDARPKLI